MMEKLNFYCGGGFSMATRGRPARIFYDSDLGKIVRFAMRMEFRTKAQQKLCDAENFRPITASHIAVDNELLTLVKTVDRERTAYRKMLSCTKLFSINRLRLSHSRI